VVVPTSDGVPNASVSFRRADLERLANEPGRTILETAAITAGARAGTPGLSYRDALYPKFVYFLRPYTEVSLFDPDNPVRADLGVDVGGSLTIAPGLVLDGRVRKRIVGNLDEITRESNSVLPRVRSEFKDYLIDGDPRLENLTLSYFNRPGDDLWGRATVGYLERMYAGVSGELLWKQPDKPYAIGAELNYVQMRDTFGGFGLQDYDVVTGHVSGYYAFGNGFHAQVDVGRYLAGDYGATFSLDREFDNGWRIGAFATFTDVPFEDFGEGSFDKGIRISMPLDFFTNRPTRKGYSTVLRPLTRDGGARVHVEDRLYGRVRGAHRPELERRDGRFWK
jgi:hypothetical protein